jgi:hypothetical protein
MKETVSEDETGELARRIELVETMISEGRRSTERWGWLFVLWGVGQLVALGWSQYGLGSSELIWHVALGACGVATLGWALWVGLRQRGRKETLVGRALGAVWWAIGSTLFLIVSVGGLAEAPLLGTAFALVGAANLISGVILSWRLQIVVGLAYWGATVVASLSSSAHPWLIGVTAAGGGVAFGLYIVLVKERG